MGDRGSGGKTTSIYVYLKIDNQCSSMFGLINRDVSILGSSIEV